MIEGIKDLIQLFKEQFTEEKLRDWVNRTFIKAGTLPINFTESSNAKFIKYKKESLCGTMKIVPVGTLNLEVEEENVENGSNDVLLDDVEALERAIINYYIDNL